MTEFLLAVLVFSVPVLGIVVLALMGRRLTKSCGGTGPQGQCMRCGNQSLRSSNQGGALLLAGDAPAEGVEGPTGAPGSATTRSFPCHLRSHHRGLS